MLFIIIQNMYVPVKDEDDQRVFKELILQSACEIIVVADIY